MSHTIDIGFGFAFIALIAAAIISPQGCSRADLKENPDEIIIQKGDTTFIYR